ncbi:PAS domain-containing protein [Pedobacter sandarakinus]|uniref:PAS domain-containing protein n=1 Tax=Pedobacter sandarakinus TaxID=353156 RepID=UPI0022450960|nr:PAS domain-containing protein [Pedobacter sandarakinus]MCX2573055.1 PAS domain-containing protein [Pedobacter sandarakinus]
MLALFSEQQGYQSLVEASPMPTAIYVGEEMIIGAANEAMLDLWGRTNGVIGQKLLTALPELEGQPFSDILANVYKTGTTYYSKEAPADLQIGGQLRRFYFTFTYKPLKNSSGDVVAIINTAAHLTELVEARKQIAETKERLAFALYSAEIGTWDLDPITNTINWDEKCRELFGFSNDCVVQYDELLLRIHPNDREMVNKAVSDAINPVNTGQYDVRYRTVSKTNGLIRWLHCKGKAYFNSDNVAYRFAGIAQDITDEIRGKRKEHELLTLINNNADHMTVATMEGEMIYMNNAARKLLGVDLETDISTFSAKDFYTPGELERVQHQILTKIDEVNGWQGTIYFQNYKTKEIIPCLVSYLLIRDPETGDIIGRGATARDLRPELKVKADLEKLAAIVGSSEDFCNYCDIKGNTLYINPSGIKLLGIDHTQISALTLFNYHSAASNEKIKSEIFPVLFAEGKWSGYLELVHQTTQEIIPIHKQFYMIREEFTRNPVAIAAIARDLRPELNIRKVLADKNAALQHAVEELSFLANSVPPVVWSSKPNGEVDYVNQRWFDQTGRTPQDSWGSRWLESLHPDDLQQTISSWQKALETGMPYETEFRCLDRFGEYRWFLVRAIPFKDQEGEIVKWYGTNTDVHDQKELEKQKDIFLGIASHELKTPVTSLKAYAQVMESMFKRSGDFNSAEMLSRMNKQIDRLTSLINDLLDVTKINAGKLQFNNTEFDFDDLVREVVEDVQHTTIKHIIRTDLNFKGMVTADRDRISQVITNLLTNAVKYSPNANEVKICSRALNNEVHVSVQDFGIGISEDLTGQVFNRFYRVSGNHEHTFPGLGLGLHISSEIVKRLDGNIWLKSVKGAGSTFSFSIPVNQQASSPINKV